MLFNELDDKFAAVRIAVTKKVIDGAVYQFKGLYIIISF